jgi:hypothetical protein
MWDLCLFHLTGFLRVKCSVVMTVFGYHVKTLRPARHTVKIFPRAHLRLGPYPLTAHQHGEGGPPSQDKALRVCL